VSFPDQETADGLVGKSIIVNGNKYYILDADKNQQKFTIKAVFKIHWLPPAQEWKEIEEYFEEIDTLKITAKNRDTYRQEPLSHIKNGVLAINFEYDLNQHGEVVKRLVGIKQFDSGLARVQISGHPPVCSFCEALHFESDCKEKKKGTYSNKVSVIQPSVDQKFVVEMQDEPLESSENTLQNEVTDASVIASNESLKEHRKEPVKTKNSISNLLSGASVVSFLNGAAAQVNYINNSMKRGLSLTPPKLKEGNSQRQIAPFSRKKLKS